MLYTLVETVLTTSESISPFPCFPIMSWINANLVRTLQEFLETHWHAVWMGWTLGPPAIKETTAKYAHWDVWVSKVRDFDLNPIFQKPHMSAYSENLWKPTETLETYLNLLPMAKNNFQVPGVSGFLVSSTKFLKTEKTPKTGN
jgi:hypothetical protein